MTIKKFGLGALTSALVSTVALATIVSPVSADIVDPLVVSDDTIQRGQSVTVTASLDDTTAPIEIGDEISFWIDGSGEATFNITDDDNLSCRYDENDGGDAIFNCGGDDVEVDTPAFGVGDELTGGDLVVRITGESTGAITINAQHEETAVVSYADAQVIGTSASGEVDSLEAAAPSSANPGDTVKVTITALDDDGDPVAGELIEVDVTSGDLNGIVDGDSASTNASGKATFEFEIDDSEDVGASLTFYHDNGSVVPPNVDVVIVIAGDADSVEVTAEESVAASSVSDVSATVLDEEGNPVPDAAIDFIVSAGNIVACDETTDGDGVAECSLVAPSTTGTIQITAVAAGAAGTTTVQVTAGTPGEGGDGTFVAPPVFGANGVGSAVFNGGTIEQLSAAVTAAGGTAVWAQGDDGNWYRYNTLATGATAFVNNAFIAEFSGGLGTIAVFVVE